MLLYDTPYIPYNIIITNSLLYYNIKYPTITINIITINNHQYPPVE
jgi:hypothetical protein